MAQRADTQRASAKKQAGDATGKQAEKLAAEHAGELRERAKEMSMSAAVAADRKENEIIDVTTGRAVGEAPVEDHVEGVDGPVTDLSTGAVSYDELSDEERAVFESSPQPSIAPADQRPLPGELPQVQPGPGIRDLGPEPEIVASDIVKFQVNTTLEDVTIGYGNTFSFEEGRWYQGPKHIADHLDEKGLIARRG